MRLRNDAGLGIVAGAGGAGQAGRGGVVDEGWNEAIGPPDRHERRAAAARGGHSRAAVAAAALGVSSLTDSPDTSLPKSVYGLVGNHTECQVCDLLNEKQEKNDGPLSTVTPDLVKIECVVDRCMLALEATDFYHTQILSPCSLSRPPNPFLRKKPPKSTA